MTRDHEMVCSMASIPVGVFLCYYIDIICEDWQHWKVKGVSPVKEVNNFGNTYWQEKCMCFIRMASHEVALFTFHLIDELALNGINITHWPTVYQGSLSFTVRPYLEALHHLYMAPAQSQSKKIIVCDMLIFLNPNVTVQ